VRLWHCLMVNGEMTMLKKLFVDHPDSVGESYFEHMTVAFGFGFQMLGGALACIIHGIVPGLFVCSGSKTINCLHDRLQEKRGGKAPSIASDAETALS
jgi:Family of unknown function (DUF6356)